MVAHWLAELDGRKVTGEVPAQGEHAVLGQPRRTLAGRFAQVVLEGFLVHGGNATIRTYQSRMTA